MTMATRFYNVEPSLENYWRGVILFGLNVASYKFALGRSLLELAERKSDFVSLEELAEPFSRHIVRHVSSGKRQATSKSSRFLDACREYDQGNLSQEKLIGKTTQLGFQNVIDAFHVVNGLEIPNRFFEDERKGRRKGIRLTENLFKLGQHEHFMNLPMEIEARWNLVETAWDLNIRRRLISVDHDCELERFFVLDENRRVDVTSSRDALNGYQKGKCFYCFCPISVRPGSTILAQVDHFIPHILKQHGIEWNVDGVWNLVLACAECNGMAGKGAKVPTSNLLERLNRRNEYLISSNHPLKETIVRQTGASGSERISFLQQIHTDARAHLIHFWEPAAKADPTF